jgi:hypothetical protein
LARRALQEKPTRLDLEILTKDLGFLCLKNSGSAGHFWIHIEKS